MLNCADNFIYISSSFIPLYHAIILAALFILKIFFPVKTDFSMKNTFLFFLIKTSLEFNGKICDCIEKCFAK